jgi:hypothetical protein
LVVSRENYSVDLKENKSVRKKVVLSENWLALQMVRLWADWMETWSAELKEIRKVESTECKLVAEKVGGSVVHSVKQSVVPKESYSAAHWGYYSVEKKGNQWAGP